MPTVTLCYVIVYFIVFCCIIGAGSWREGEEDVGVVKGGIQRGGIQMVCWLGVTGEVEATGGTFAWPNLGFRAPS